MRIVVCAKRDLLSCHFLNQLLPLLQGHELHVWLADKTRPQEHAVAALAEIAFIERTLPVDLLFPLLDTLPAATLPPAEQATFHGLSRRYGIQVETVADVNSPAMLQRLRQLQPDLLISARFSHIFKAAALAIPRHGIVNVHPGELPRYAGLFAPMRMLLEGATELACTVHWIDEGIDTGPIVAVHRQPLQRQHGLVGQINQLYCLAIPTLLEQIEALASGQPTAGLPQDASTRCYRSLPGADEMAQFAASGVAYWKPDEYRDWLLRFIPGGLSADAAGKPGAMPNPEAWQHWLQSLTAHCS